MPTTCPNCDGPVEQSGRGRPRRFCSLECGIKFANDQKPRKYGKGEYDARRHMLTNITPDAEKTGYADCSQCGPRVRVWDVGGTKMVKWRCRVAVDGQAGRIRYKHGRDRETAWARRGIQLTMEEFDQLFAEQGGGCAICGAELEHRAKETHVDHCHSSSRVRGLLCGDCNRGLGKFKDDPARLRRAVEYLERHEGGGRTEQVAVAHQPA